MIRQTASLIMQTLDDMIAIQDRRGAVATPPPARQGMTRPAPSASADIIAALNNTTEKLQSHPWSDRELRQIDSEDLARLAYQLSDRLQSEFHDESTFICYWRNQRAQHGRHAVERYSMRTHEDPQQEQQLRAEWSQSPALRLEFRDNFGAYKAFKKAEAAGQVKICRGGTVKGA